MIIHYLFAGFVLAILLDKPIQAQYASSNKKPPLFAYILTIIAWPIWVVVLIISFFVIVYREVKLRW